MASLKALMTLVFVAVLATLSGAFAQGEFGLSPAPSPDAGAGCSLPLSAALVASSLLLSLLAFIKN